MRLLIMHSASNALNYTTVHCMVAVYTAAVYFRMSPGLYNTSNGL